MGDQGQVRAALSGEFGLECRKELGGYLVGPFDNWFGDASEAGHVFSISWCPCLCNREEQLTGTVRRFRYARDELVQEDDLALLVVDVGLHVHSPDVGVVGEVVSEGAVVGLPMVSCGRSEMIAISQQRILVAEYG